MCCGVGGKLLGFELLCTNATDSSDEGVCSRRSLTSNKSMLQLKAASKDPSPARGSRYAWAAWPLSTLFAETKDGELGCPFFRGARSFVQWRAKPGAVLDLLKSVCTSASNIVYIVKMSHSLRKPIRLVLH